MTLVTFVLPVVLLSGIELDATVTAAVYAPEDGAHGEVIVETLTAGGFEHDALFAAAEDPEALTRRIEAAAFEAALAE